MEDPLPGPWPNWTSPLAQTGPHSPITPLNRNPNPPLAPLPPPIPLDRDRSPLSPHPRSSRFSRTRSGRNAPPPLARPRRPWRPSPPPLRHRQAASLPERGRIPGALPRIRPPSPPVHDHADAGPRPELPRPRRTRTASPDCLLDAVVPALFLIPHCLAPTRSEERRVGKEC